MNLKIKQDIKMKKQRIRITWEGVISVECNTVVEAAHIGVHNTDNT